MNCDKCEYAATIVADLKRHFQIKGEREISISFDKCEYAATSAGSPKRHIESKHEGVRYPFVN